MARPITIRVKALKELQQAMKKMETAIEPREVKPILADALRIFHAKAVEILRSKTKRAKRLPQGWEHIEDALQVKEGRSDTFAIAFAKVFRKASPHALWIEYGHRIQAKRVAVRKATGYGMQFSKSSTGEVQAYPFFRPALDLTRRLVTTHIRKGIQQLVKSAAMREGFTNDGTSPDDTGWIG